MQVSKIIDFTSIIHENPDTYNFNPSIARWKNNLYLCAYRSFHRESQLNLIPEKYEDILKDPNHPWFGGPETPTWWKQGNDWTSFFIMSISEDKLVNVKSLNDSKSLYLSTFENNKQIISKIDEKYLKVVDSRLLHLIGDYFLFSFNIGVQNDLKIKETSCNTKEGCFLIGISLLKLDYKGDLHVYKQNILCPEISNQTEKNWSFWVYNEKIYFSYGLSPFHTVYNTSVDFITGDIICDPRPLQEKLGFFGKLENYYNLAIFKNLNDKIFYISVTTPAIPKRDDPTKYIGIGHVKYKNKDRIINLIPKSPLGLFYKQANKIKRHPVYDYLMFIYEFDPKTAEITRTTDMFVPNDAKYLVTFPSGLEYSPDGNIMISYGDYDSLCKMMFIKFDIINKLLKPILVEDELIISPTPLTLNFIPFPSICIEKKGLCSLILNNF